MRVSDAIAWLFFAGSVIGFVAGWFLVMINMFRVVANRKEGAPLFPNWYEGPFNYICRPSQLTERGLAARRWYFYGVASMVLSAILAAITSYVYQTFFNPTH
jgi:hypothetical protein